MTIFLYLISVVIVNILFDVLPMIDVLGAKMPLATVVVGLIFIMRDYAQRDYGHWVILAMLTAGVLSYFMASPFIALASIAAFLISEFADWVVYTVSRRPLRDRILLSSAVSTPLDSFVFLSMIDMLTVAGFAVMTASKMLAAVVIWFSLNRRHGQIIEKEA